MHINHLRFYYNKHQKLHEYSMTAHYNHLQHVIKSAKSIRIILMLRFKMSYILSHCMVLFRFVLPFYLFPRPPVTCIFQFLLNCQVAAYRFFYFIILNKCILMILRANFMIYVSIFFWLCINL